jgi:hypothetical protein
MRAAKPSLQQTLPGKKPTPPPASKQDTTPRSSCNSSRGSSAGTATTVRAPDAAPAVGSSRQPLSSRRGSRGDSAGSVPASSTLGALEQRTATVAPGAVSPCSCDDPWSGNSHGSNGGSGSLLAGAYDEAAAGQSFQEALREWRTAGATSNSGSKCSSSSNVRRQPSSQGAPDTLCACHAS